MLHRDTPSHFDIGHVERAASGQRGSVRPERGIRVEDAGGIRKVILDRRSQKNAITVAMYGELEGILSEAATNPRTHVVLLGSSGGAFSIGSDLSDFLNGSASAAECETFAHAEVSFVRSLASFPKPIVAAVNGLAVGVGATMLLHCDFVVASQFAAFQFPCARLAMVPDAASSVLLPARIGLQTASEWLFLGERIDAATALRFGLLNAIVPLEDLASAALARAEALARLPQSAVRETKRLLREPLRALVEEALGRELGAIAAQLASPEAAATFSAFLSHGR
jgi:enoyl-CoA hydratase/carnithine racemase